MTNRKTRSNSPLKARRKTLNKVIVPLLLLLSFSCNQDLAYHKFSTIDGFVWEKDKSYNFTFALENTSIPYDIDIHLRNNHSYPYRNLWVICNTTFPSGIFLRDTLNFIVADQSGKWSGDGISLFHNAISFRKEYHFLEKGNYTISIRQAMTDQSLEGIQEIGISVKKTK